VTDSAASDYLVVGAGATRMAFTDALIDHADVRVAMVLQRAARRPRVTYPAGYLDEIRQQLDVLALSMEMVIFR
jgi:hypothetical protein